MQIQNFFNSYEIQNIVNSLKTYSHSKNPQFSSTVDFLNRNLSLFSTDPILACSNLCALGGWICTNPDIPDAPFYAPSAVYDLCDRLRHEFRLRKLDSCEISNQVLKGYSKVTEEMNSKFLVD